MSARPAPGEAPLSRFLLGPELARGGMGAVHLGTDAVTGDKVAVKMLFANSTDEARARFLRELRACSALDSRFICRPVAWGIGDESAKSYLAMEFIDGPTLAALAKRSRQQAEQDPSAAIPASVVVEILRQLLEGLTVAHAASVLHRDLKPANVMVTTSGEVKLVDFGISRAATDGTVTKTGDVIGTPAFMSPEQVRGQPLDGRSDLFSLGVTIQALIRGVHRFRDLDSTQMLVRTMSESTAPLLEEARGMPVTLDGVLAALTAMDPDDRPSDARAALVLLEDAGVVQPGGQALLAAFVADHLAKRSDVARRENLAAAQADIASAEALKPLPGAEAAVLLCYDRAAALQPTGAGPDTGRALRDAWAQANGLAIEEPADPAIATRAAEAVADALKAWRDPIRSAVSAKRAADLYLTGRCPRRQAIWLWRYVRQRPDDTLALERLRVLLDGPTDVSDTQRRLSTRSIVAGIRTGGKPHAAPRTGDASTRLSRARTDASVGPRGAFVSAPSVAGAPPVVMLSGDGTGAGRSVARAAIALVLLASLVLVWRVVADSVRAPAPSVEERLAVDVTTATSADADAGRRLARARAALAASDWGTARILASEVLAADAPLDVGQDARAIRIRANEALGELERARPDLEAYRARVTRDDDPFLPEVNRLLSALRDPPPRAELR